MIYSSNDFLFFQQKVLVVSGSYIFMKKMDGERWITSTWCVTKCIVSHYFRQFIRQRATKHLCDGVICFAPFNSLFPPMRWCCLPERRVWARAYTRVQKSFAFAIEELFGSTGFPKFWSIKMEHCLPVHFEHTEGQCCGAPSKQITLSTLEFSISWWFQINAIFKY